MKPSHIAIASPIVTSSFLQLLNTKDNLPKGIGGNAVNNLVLGLLKEGIKVSIYTLTPEITEPVYASGENLSIYFGPIRKKARFRIADLFRKESAWIVRFAKKDKPDLIHAQWGYEYAYGAVKSGLPHLITLRDSPWKVLWLKKDVYRFARFLVHMRVLKKGKNFVVNSPYLREEFKSNFPVIPNAIVQYEIPKSTEKEELRIVSVLNGWGNIKNASKGLEAFAILRKKLNNPIKYYLIGQDFGKNEIAQQWAEERGLAEDVVFKGLLPHSLVVKEVSEATLMLHPSKEESFGNVIAEALSVGVPVVGGKHSGAVPWLLGNGERGMLVDINDAERICEGVLSLLKDEELQQRFSEAGRSFVEKNLTQKVICEMHIEHYARICNL